jgi:hypothetical protein
MRIINILRRLRSSILDIYGQLAIGHVQGLKEARSRSPKLEISLERRARETGGGGVVVHATGERTCWFLLPFASYWVAIVQESGGDLTQ